MLLIMPGFAAAYYTNPTDVPDKQAAIINTSEGMAKVIGYSGDTVIKSLASYGLTTENAPVIHSGDKLVTSDNSSVEIVFRDGSLLIIEPNSMVRICLIHRPARAAADDNINSAYYITLKNNRKRM